MAQSSQRKHYAAIMAVIGSGHALSHFYLLCLPPLFPLLKDEFAVSYAALGLLVTLMNVATGLFQVPSGFLVDRIGARKVLAGGLLIMGAAIALIGLAPHYWVILAIVLIAGVGNSVVHPADYAILNAAVPHGRVGRAFALHTFAGNGGFVLAPTTITMLAALWDWRAALIAVGLVSVPVAIALLRCRELLGDDRELATRAADRRPADAGGAGIRPLMSRGVVTMFLFFVCTAMVTGGVHTFSVTAMVDLQAIGLTSASTVLTVFLTTSAVGVLLGGPLADRTRRHRLVVTLAMAISAVLMVAIGNLSLPVIGLAVLFGVVGLLQGSVRPSRDMMVRAVTPKGAAGRVFAFVSSGLNLGAAVTPVLFGLLVDLGHPRWVFIVMGVILVLAIATVGGTGRPRTAAPAAQRAAAE
jgi:MFS family permease